MKNFIRILNAAVALAVAVIMGTVAYANAVYPDEFYIKNDSVGVIDDIFILLRMMTEALIIKVLNQSALRLRNYPF